MKLRMAAAAIIVSVATLLALASVRNGPVLVIEESVANDLELLAEITADQFFATFPAHERCIGAVRLTVDHNLEDRARYDPERSLIIVRVPAPAVILERALVHELAHHVEFECDAHEEMRSEFLAALGLDADSAWFENDVWSETPSEIFAEAVVEVVFPGSGAFRSDLREIPSRAVDVVARWAHSG
jgi:hypothetical protein